MSKYQCDYSYFVTVTQEVKCLIIQDNNKPKTKSVTNSLNKIVDFICGKENIDYKEYIIVYKDTINIWDGYDHKKKKVVFLGASTWGEAIELYKFKLKM